VQDIPEIVWKEIQFDIENETAAAILLLIIAADDWTTTEIQGQGVRSRKLTSQQLGSYAMDAAERASDMAASTTNTLRDRLTRKVEDMRISGPGKVGNLTPTGIDKALDEVLTDQRRETLAVDQTTQGLSRGQMGARDRAGGDGASTTAGQSVEIELYWVTERDDKVCPRCSPLHDKPESVWGRVFPSGPGSSAHPNCRCSLRPVVVVQRAAESAPPQIVERVIERVEVRQSEPIVIDNAEQFAGMEARLKEHIEARPPIEVHPTPSVVIDEKLVARLDKLESAIAATHTRHAGYISLQQAEMNRIKEANERKQASLEDRLSTTVKEAVGAIHIPEPIDPINELTELRQQLQDETNRLRLSSVDSATLIEDRLGVLRDAIEAIEPPSIPDHTGDLATLRAAIQALKDEIHAMANKKRSVPTFHVERNSYGEIVKIIPEE
jgi:hypothetical protein